MGQSEEGKTHKVGIIGVGGRGRLLAQCIRLCEPAGMQALSRQYRGLPSPVNWRAEIVAVADPTEDCRQKAAAVLPEGCPIYADPVQVVARPDVEVVVVATASIAHAQWVVAALDAGKDAICEKPMTTTLEDADRIAAAVESGGRVFGLSMQNRYSFWATTVSRLLRDGDMGTLKMMWCHEFRCPFWPRPQTANWISKMLPSGGPFLEKNSHHWDIFNMWAQAPAVRVFAQTQDTGSHRELGDIWDCSWANVEYANGVMASHGLSLMTRFGHSLTMGTIGTGGWAEAVRTPDGGTVTYRDNVGPQERVFRAGLPTSASVGHAGAEIPMFNHLFDCIERRVQPATDCWWGRESILMGLAAQRSADERRAVEVDEIREESAFPGRGPSYAE